MTEQNEPIPLSPPGEMIPCTYINVKGREEHEALLRDPKKCEELGLDIYYETFVYLKRWGAWLNDRADVK